MFDGDSTPKFAATDCGDGVYEVTFTKQPGQTMGFNFACVDELLVMTRLELEVAEWNAARKKSATDARHRSAAVS